MAAIARSLVEVKVVPSIQIRCRIPASLRAFATFARLPSIRWARRLKQ